MTQLKALRKSTGETQAALANILGITRAAYTNIENGKREPDYETIKKLANHFSVSIDYLLGNESRVPSSSGTLAPSVPGGKWVPVLGTIPAGTPLEAIEDILDYEEITPDMALHGEYFGLRIKGHSMEPRISDGDVIIVRQQDDCESGDTAVVLVNGDEATVKRIKKTPEGIMLIPNNPAYETMFYSNLQIENLPVRVIGKVVELRAKF